MLFDPMIGFMRKRVRFCPLQRRRKLGEAGLGTLSGQLFGPIVGGLSTGLIEQLFQFRSLCFGSSAVLLFGSVVNFVRGGCCGHLLPRQ